MAIPNVWQLLFNGVGISAFYALFAVGLTLIFGVMGIVNFAHGELYMLGAYAVWLVITIGSDSLPLVPLFIIGLVVGMLAVGGLGIVIEKAIFKPLRTTPFAVFMSSLGILYVLRVAVGETFGFKGKAIPVVFPGQVTIAGATGATISFHWIIIIVVAVILLGLLWFFLERTKLGRGVRASSQDSEAAALQGISINRMSALVMGMGAALAAAAGALIGCRVLIVPFMGWDVLWKAFIIVIAGGLGSVGGAIVTSILFGFLDSLVASLGEPRMVIMIDVLVLLTILAIRPQGLLGRGR